jgi:formylglycine-generating enzyme required for sulfatase activity
VLFHCGTQSLCSAAGHRNSLEMTMVEIPAGEFRMGNDGEVAYSQLDGYAARGSGNPPLAANPLEWDETPSHVVRITRPFHLASMPVTNRQFEKFRPAHRELRGTQGFSTGDDEAVVFVSWHDAVEFCAWLSTLEKKTYRLPTEAEWEYACRAGTTTPYHTGDRLPREYHQNQVSNRQHAYSPEKVSLRVGAAPPNGWGLYDMHGPVEQWCSDWYGPYTRDASDDPIGWKTGIARVTRGGSHSTALPYLRSANRSAALPESRSFLIGFRVALGDPPVSEALPAQRLPRWARGVDQRERTTSFRPSTAPVFRTPKTFTHIPDDANGPLYITHNHQPSLTDCPNGDLLATWFTTVTEQGREMVIAASRLRYGRDEWDDPDVFFHVADRNLTGGALWWDGRRTLYHFNGVGAGDHWRSLMLVLRTSNDNGATWTTPRIIGPEHTRRHQAIDSMMRTTDGALILAADATWSGAGGTAVHISRDDGRTWTDPGVGQSAPRFEEGSSGGWIAGIHAGIVPLNDGRWLALGRGNEIRGRMPMSISADNGVSWQYSASPFQPIAGAQRLSLLRLREGPILLLSFATDLPQVDSSGKAFSGSGMFAALSFDEGKSWPVQKLITPGGPRRVLTAPCNRRWGKQYSTLDHNRAESRGYLTAIQTQDATIHVLSSGTHYQFNLAWLRQPHTAAGHPVQN